MNHPQSNPLPSTAATIWKQRYEDLRQLAVTGSQILGAQPLGLVLLLREGVAGWMRGWPTPEQTSPRTPAPPPRDLLIATPAWQQQLAALLAEMSLAHLPNIAKL